MADLSGKVAVVTGAGRGLGRGIAEGLAEAGATIYLTARTESFDDPPADGSIQATARRVAALGGTAVPVRVHHGRDEEVQRLFERVRDEQGRLDLLVNNVWEMPAPPMIGRPFWEQPVSLWDSHCGIGLRGYYACAVGAARAMASHGSGLIVHVSPAGGGSDSSSTPHGVSRVAVDRLAREMARELAPHGVAALSLWPDVPGREPVAKVVQGRPLGADVPRFGSPRFTGRCIAALAMDPDVMEKSGGAYRVGDLAGEYRFTDPGA